MEFVYANELKSIFHVKGHFYTLKLNSYKIPCRSILTIKNKQRIRKEKQTDAIIIMMNPGSSLPIVNELDKTFYYKKDLFNSKNRKLVAAKPDNTQYQIMRLMLLRQWSFVKVINLSDIQAGNSKCFSKLFKDLHKIDKTNPHSIFHVKRKKELSKILQENKSEVIIAAWGSSTVLKPTAQVAIKNLPNLIGIKQNHPWFRFASPYRKDHKLQWLKTINFQLKQSLV